MRQRGSTGTLGYQLDIVGQIQFFGTNDVNKIPHFQKSTMQCVINILDEGGRAGETTSNKILSKPTYHVYINEIETPDDTSFTAIHAWINQYSPRLIQEEEGASGDEPDSPEHFYAPETPLQIQQKKLIAEQSLIQGQETSARQKIETQAIEAVQRLRQTHAIETARKFSDAINSTHTMELWSSPILQQFGADIKNPARQTGATLSQDEFVYIMNTFKNFTREIMQRIFFYKKWKSYGRYFSKTTSGIPGTQKSFLIFTKKDDLNVFYILIRSNIHISDIHQKQTAEGDVLWAEGSTKKVKLYGLLLKLRLQYPNIVPDPITPVRQIVTFTWPASLKLIVGSSTKTQRTQAKSAAMHKLLTDLQKNSEFSDWDGLLMFQVNTIQKILAYQIFAGQSFDRAHSVLNGLSSDQKLYAILSMLKHLQSIICEQHTWPTDIKFDNLAYSPAFIQNPGYYNLSFIDFQSRVTTYTFLKGNQANYPISAPVFMTRQYYKDSCRELDARQATLQNNGIRLKLIAYHLCFELVLCIFFIVNDLVRHCCLSLFLHRQTWIQEPQLAAAIDNELSKSSNPHPSVNDMPFFHILLQYAYRHDFLTDSTKTVFDVLKLFFEQIRTEIIIKIDPQINAGSRMSSPIESASDDSTKILSNGWIDMVCAGFQEIKNTPQKSTTVQIEQIEPI